MSLIEEKIGIGFAGIYPDKQRSRVLKLSNYWGRLLSCRRARSEASARCQVVNPTIWMSAFAGVTPVDS
jgi:hypothetical protein